MVNKVLAKKLATRQEVRQIVRSSILASQELKRYVVAFTGQNTSTTGSVSPVTQGIIQGDSLLTRDGDQILVKKLVFRYQLEFSSGGSATTQRVIIFWDNQANGATPAVTDVLNSASYITGYQPVLQQQGRFHILLDEFFTSVANGQNGKNALVRTFKLNHKTTFLDLTNVATANGKGALFVLFLADAANGLYSASYEVHFTDS